jgi:hypothetical protein
MAKPWLLSSVVSSKVTGTPFFKVISLGVKLNLLAETFTVAEFSAMPGWIRAARAIAKQPAPANLFNLTLI